MTVNSLFTLNAPPGIMQFAASSGNTYTTSGAGTITVPLQDLNDALTAGFTQSLGSLSSALILAGLGSNQSAFASSIMSALAANPSGVTTALANNNALLLPNWRLALSKTRDNIADSRILCVGDSTFQGNGGTGSPEQSTTSFPARLATFLNGPTNSAGLPINQAVNGLATPNQSGSSSDTRWAAGTGWNDNAGFGAGANSCYQASAGAAGTLVFTPAPATKCDGFYVYYIGAGSNTFLATATGGTGVTVNTPSTGGTYKSALVSAASAATNNTLTISAAASTAGVFIVGVEPVLSTTRQVLVGNAGVGGSRTTNWVSGAPFGGVNLIEAVAPNLTIINLGINDVYNGISLATSMSNLQTLITAAQLSGDVMLASMPPAQTSPGTTLEPAFVAALQALASTNKCLFLDFYNRFGGVWNSNFMYDFTHPNDYGYWDWASAAYNLLNAM